jgi:hypothetical protein
MPRRDVRDASTDDDPMGADYGRTHRDVRLSPDVLRVTEPKVREPDLFGQVRKPTHVVRGLSREHRQPRRDRQTAV